MIENNNINGYVEKVNTRANGFVDVENNSISLVEGKGRKARLTEMGKRAAASYAYALMTAPEVLDLPAVESTFDWARENLNKEKDNASDVQFRDYVRLLNSSLRMRERYLKDKIRVDEEINEEKSVVLEDSDTKSPKYVSLEEFKGRLSDLKVKAKEAWNEVKDFTGEHLPKVGWGMLAVSVLGACSYVYTDTRSAVTEQKFRDEFEKIPVVQMTNEILQSTKSVLSDDFLIPVSENEHSFMTGGVEKEEVFPTTTVEVENYYSWLEQKLGNGPSLDLSKHFKLVLPEETVRVYGKKTPTEFIPEMVDIHRYHTPDEAAAAGFAESFERNSLESRNHLAVQQGNNDRAIVYGHSGSVVGIEWPLNFVKDATWYEEKILGKNIEIYYGQYKYVYRIDQITTVTRTEFESASREFADPNRPLMKDLSVLGVDIDLLEQPGIDFVVCGGKGVSMKEYRTVMSTVLVSQEWVEINEVSAANYYKNEYYESTLPNIEIAANIVNSDFNNDPFSPGETWSYLEAVNYFADNEWVQPPGKLYAAGACDVATMMVRATESFSRSIGLSFNRLDTGNMRETWGNSLFEVNLWPHSFYEKMPVDMVAVESQSRKPDSGNSDMTIAFSENVNGVIIPADAELKFVTKKDENGNFKIVVESNYSIAQWQEWVKKGFTFKQGN